jgi:hypothetical protein
MPEIKVIAEGYLKKARATPTAWPIQGLLGLAGMWLIANLVHLFSSPAITETTVALLTFSLYAVFVWGAVAYMRRATAAGRRSHQTEALVLALYNNAVAIVISLFWLRLYLDVGGLFGGMPIWLSAIGVAGYFVVGIIALSYAPHSFPSTNELKRQAEERAAKWTPFAIALPAAGVSIGTALGAVFLHYSPGWGFPLISALSLLLACLILGFSMINLQRTWLFAKGAAQQP